MAKIPFSKETADHVLCFLTSESWWDETIHGLYDLFSLDPDFSEVMFAKQISVMRGQCYNLIEILRRNGTPLDLVSRPLVTFVEEAEPSSLGDKSLVERSKRSFKNVQQKFTHTKACFKSC